MNKKLQDKAWSILPKEYREEVKKEYKHQIQIDNEQAYWMLERIFGKHNLTSDNENLSESKPSKPRFKVNDKVFYVCSITVKHKCTVTTVMQDEHSGKWEYNVLFDYGKPGLYISESDLEPNTEPDTSHDTPVCENHSDNTSQKEVKMNSNRNLSQETANCDKHFDNILKDSFRNERRLNIAAMVIASIMGSSDWSDYRGATDEDVWRNMAKASLGVADALLAECEQTKTDSEIIV